MPEKILYADGALADLFGLDPTIASQGLPIESYLERVHPEDKPRLAKTIRDSIIADRLQQETYRVMNSDGDYIFVIGFGRGFRSKVGPDQIKKGGFEAARFWAQTWPSMHGLTVEEQG